MQFAKEVAAVMRPLRNMLLPHWGTAVIVGQKDHSPVNIVTQLDFDVENFVSSELQKKYPDIPFVGEENGGDRGAERFWIMDPIDGTAHFVRGLPFCTSQIALVVDGKITCSVIYDFVSDKMYYAEAGEGAFCESERIHVSNRPLAASYIVCESKIQKSENLAIRQELFEQAVLFQSISAGWEFAMVASGKLDGRVMLDPYGKDYDLLPGALLVAEAGGTVANIGSNSYDYKNLNFIAANPVIYKELTEGDGAIFPLFNTQKIPLF